MKNVPAYARVDKPTYRQVRNYVAHTAKFAGFDEVGLWDLVIDAIEKRHANVVKNKAKAELTLVEAGDKICKAAIKEREQMATAS